MITSMWELWLGVFVVYVGFSSAHRSAFPFDPVAKSVQQNDVNAADHPWITDHFDVPIDNFAYTSNATYSMRYLYNNTYYKKGGPIFFYAGNEGAIEGFAMNTGIMFDLAPLFNASILFAEHRYYGVSQPFGNESYSNVTKLGFLASTQALADYARFLPYYKANVLKDTEAPVIAFGGSYGGMLAAWFRIKYPHIIDGAWAASAPVLYFKGGNVDPGAFDKVVTKDFVDAGCDRTVIEKGWTAIRKLAKTEEGRAFLNDVFHVEEKSKLQNESNAEDLIYFIREAFEYFAMVDYPYSTSFLQPLPGWPVQAACNLVKKQYRKPPTEDKELVKYLYIISNLYYNSTGHETTNCVISKVCGDPATNGLGSDALGWPWQSCTELVMEICAEGGKNDFFWDECKEADGVLNMVKRFCLKTFKDIGYTEKFLFENDAPIEYGLEFAAASNIVFTNGNLDPWSVGGVFEDTPGVKEAAKNGVYTFFITNGAHHLDIRQPNTCDPESVKNARFQIVQIIKCWIDPDCENLPSPKPLPTQPPPTKEKCKEVINGYPWGQA